MTELDTIDHLIPPIANVIQGIFVFQTQVTTLGMGDT